MSETPWRLHACVWLVLRRSQASPHNVFTGFDVYDGGPIFDFTYANLFPYVFPVTLTGKRPALFGGTRPVPAKTEGPQAHGGAQQ